MRCQIKLNSITDVKEFVNITFKAENDVDLICGKYHIDGKSIMGIFSLELDILFVASFSNGSEIQSH